MFFKLPTFYYRDPVFTGGGYTETQLSFKKEAYGASVEFQGEKISFLESSVLIAHPEKIVIISPKMVKEYVVNYATQVFVNDSEFTGTVKELCDLIRDEVFVVPSVPSGGR